MVPDLLLVLHFSEGALTAFVATVAVGSFVTSKAVGTDAKTAFVASAPIPVGGQFLTTALTGDIHFLRLFH
jgi:hypothetical protein